MKVTFETEDPTEIKRLAKSSDMAGFIWELTHNSLRGLDYNDIDPQPFRDIINDLLERFEINVDDIQ